MFFVLSFIPFFSSQKHNQEKLNLASLKATGNLNRQVRRSAYPLIVLLLVLSGFLKQFQAFDLPDEQWDGHLEPLLQTHSIENLRKRASQRPLSEAHAPESRQRGSQIAKGTDDPLGIHSYSTG